MLFADSTIIGISPFQNPDPRLVVGLCRAGAVGVLDAGLDEAAARAAVDEVERWVEAYGLRIPAGCTFWPSLLSDATRVLVLASADQLASVADCREGRKVLVQVRSLDDARAAAAADGVIAVGNECGGLVDDESTFVLVQHLAEQSLPIWAQGGIGLHTAAAAIAGGAVGVVLDEQLALVREARTPAPLKQALGAMDGSETTIVGDHRVFTRPDIALDTTLSAEAVSARLGADLGRQLVPVGQGARVARSFAERFRTAGGVVSAIKTRIERNLALAQTLQPLRRGGEMAEEHGTEFSVAQGPMTRVSDRAEFAKAVADGGGLPFLALALLRGNRVDELLAKTSELLGDQPWGVGILGFVPPELREEQLAVIRKYKPPFALIAGGRPSQARPLEADGTRVYLHVPSPGLLDLYLKDGARRFVFEGRECGGHVGPRSSFSLWEAQVERLLAFDDPASLSLLFAGGIHDGRSAAMVSALTAELAERGARIGVLMGTAYLFTHEAVSSGAILQGFQDEAEKCARTALLETAPGHATRCVETNYVRAFRAERARLEAEGLSSQEVWAKLEELNLGRLRIASKGVKRVGSELVQVDTTEQHDDGMYMIGQVAALREGRCSVRELHESVSDGSVEQLGSAAPEVDEAPSPARVAIVGMACIFPDAPDTETFWANVVGGANAITEVPPERWNPEIYYDGDSTNGEKTPSKWGGFLPNIAFDPAAYGIPPRSLAAVEPVQLLALEVAARALGDAGYEGRDFSRENTSVIFGAEAGTELAGGYGFRAFFPQLIGELPQELDDHLPTLTEDSFPGVLANVIAGRIANRLDLGGCNYTVDAACASSLAAVDLAVKELTQGTSDMVIAGGADLHNSINDYLLFASVHALSRRGQCQTFDADADGIVLGEGVAAVVLKRLSDAERDGDRIYAVIDAVAGSSDGKSLGLTAPRKEGQQRALRRAYSRAGISPAAVGLVEAHGTGTVVGDRTEMATLTEVFLECGAEVGQSVLGSVKSQIGHTKCAAGLAGLIKSALAIHHRVLPPTLNVKSPNPYWNAETSPFVFNDVSTPWLSDRRVAGISAFGFGGTNFHAVLTEYDGPDRPPVATTKWSAELFLFRGETADGAVDQIRAVRELIEREPGLRLADLAASVNAATGSVHVAVVASDRSELLAKLDVAATLTADPRGVWVAPDAAVAGGQVAVLFPGQGSQRPNMLLDLFVAFPELQSYLSLGSRWLDKLLPPQVWTDGERAAQKAAITDTRVAQPTLGIAGLAMHHLLDQVGLRADMVGGHSYGELVALAVAGGLDVSELLELSEARGKCILEASGDDPGTMAAVSAPEAEVLAAIAGIDGVVLANVNSPRQTVISGTTDGVGEAVKVLKGAGLTARGIPVACAFHSPVVAGAQTTFRARLDAATVGTPSIPVWSNTTVAPHGGPEAIRETLAAHVAKPVRFVQQIEAMYEAGARIFVEAGPGRVLSGLVGQILGDKPHVAIATNRGRGDGLAQFLGALAQLAVAGVHIDASALSAGRDVEPFDLARPPSTVPRPTAWWVNGHRAWPMRGELPAVGMKVTTAPILTRPLTGSAPSLGTDRDAVMVEYLSTMRSMVDQQRDVMLRYLGDTAPAPVAQAAAPALQASAPAEAEAVPTAEVVEDEDLSVSETLLGIVSERTGYPVEMLGLDLDLEADLSIDSIKRIEILGELGERLGLGEGADSDRDALIEQLASIKTLRGIIDWLENQRAGDAEADSESSTEADGPVADTDETPVAPQDVARFVLAVEDAPPAKANGGLSGRSVLITDDGRGVADALRILLESDGATPRIVTDTGDGAEADDTSAVAEGDLVVDLEALGGNGSHHPAKRLFSLARQAVDVGATGILTATDLGGDFGRSTGGDGLLRGGAAGLIKTIAKERPDLKARLVDLDPTEDAVALARHIYDELRADDALLEVGYQKGLRKTLIVQEATDGGVEPLPLTGDDVVLITGGARGITARIAETLASRGACKLELVGRSPLPPEAEPEELAAAADEAALRAILVKRGELKTPREIGAAVRRLLADRQIRATLERLRTLGSEVVYHSVDVRDTEAFGALVDDIYQRHGRLDGVIHGAGVLEDKLLVHKSADSFDRVFDTKVAGALTLAEKLRPDVRFLVFFGSVAGAFGNRGQSDYAAANDALDKLALSLGKRLKGRVVSIDWGPWGGTGMVTPELEREYARRGIGLIPPDGGVASFMSELTADRDDPQVILMCAEPKALQ